MTTAVVPGAWTRWTYYDWNRHLAQHFLVARTPEEFDVPVQRISATTEELARVARADPSEAPAVVDAFVGRVRRELKPGQGFCDYCLGYHWDSDDYPPFFAMLWFTCLIAYGYPEGRSGSFHERLATALGKSESFQAPGEHSPCLPTLWESVASWSETRHRHAASIRRLILPENVGRRTIIGYSHFLAFPNRFDRVKLATLLRDSDLVGAEPPIRLLLDTLLRHRRTFSGEFQEDFDDFLAEYRRGSSDPRDNAFWRAVRQEAMSPSDTAPSETSTVGFLAFAYEDDALLPVLSWRIDSPTPAGYFVEPFDDGLSGSRLVGPSDDREQPSREAVTLGKFLGPRDRRLLKGGVVPLRENDAGLFLPTSGEEVHGCSTALVTQALVAQFVERFGGTTRPSPIAGWREVHACNIVQLDDLPPWLIGATSLLRTTELPPVVFVDGIRVTDGFLFAPSFLPTLRAPGAVSVEVTLLDGSRVECNRTSPNEWGLPPSVSQPGEYLIRALWQVETDSGPFNRARSTSLRLRPHTVTNQYKGLPSGEFFQESCSQHGESALTSPAEPALTVTTSDPLQSTDVVEFDATVRFLGPGLGEMALAPQPGFDWIAVGPKNDPQLVMYVGRLETPTPPRIARSPNAGDRRHWQKAWQVPDSRRYCRIAPGECVPWHEMPAAIQAVWARYRTHSVPTHAERCAETRLGTLTFSPAPSEVPEPRVDTVLEAIAALSSNRRGLPYAILSNLFARLLGHDEVLLVRQLVRAWVEAGLIDEVRHAVAGRLLFVARRPQLVLVRRGPMVEATLIGLSTPATSWQFKNTATRLSLPIVELHPCNPWQPIVHRTHGHLPQLEHLRTEMDLPPSTWLQWPDRDRLPNGLDARAALGTLFTTSPPNSFAHDASWDWSEGMFRRGATAPDGDIQLTRRMNPNQLTLYVVSLDARPVCWTYQRSWALLAAYGHRGTPPFVADRASGRLKSLGRMPVHLPMPIARLCILVGEGAPGPRMIPSGRHEYVYPFGRRLFALIRHIVPDAWIAHS